MVAANQPWQGPVKANGKLLGSDAKKNHTARGNVGQGTDGSQNGAFQKPNPAVPRNSEAQ